MAETQLLKGVLEGCVLEVIAKKPIYGYELVQELRQAGFSNLVGGTIYPLLQKLEKKHYIQGEMRPSSDGPDRKYFTLTDEGRMYLARFWQQWQDLVTTVNRIGGKTDDKNSGD